jgi:hypothetical protein
MQQDVEVALASCTPTHTQQSENSMIYICPTSSVHSKSSWICNAWTWQLSFKLAVSSSWTISPSRRVTAHLQATASTASCIHGHEQSCSLVTFCPIWSLCSMLRRSVPGPGPEALAMRSVRWWFDFSLPYRGPINCGQSAYLCYLV